MPCMLCCRWGHFPGVDAKDLLQGHDKAGDVRAGCFGAGPMVV